MLSICGDMPVSTQSTLRANARSGWGWVLGCPLPIVSHIFTAVSTHDPPCEQLFTMVGVGVSCCPSCLALESLTAVETGAGVVVVVPPSFVVHRVG